MKRVLLEHQSPFVSCLGPRTLLALRHFYLKMALIQLIPFQVLRACCHVTLG